MINYHDVEISDLLLVQINEFQYFGMVESKHDNKILLSNVIYGDLSRTHTLNNLILYRYDLENKSVSINVKRCLKPENGAYNYALQTMKMEKIMMIFPELFI